MGFSDHPGRLLRKLRLHRSRLRMQGLPFMDVRPLARSEGGAEGGEERNGGSGEHLSAGEGPGQGLRIHILKVGADRESVSDARHASDLAAEQ